jgi:hypothetical protein
VVPVRDFPVRVDRADPEDRVDPEDFPRTSPAADADGNAAPAAAAGTTCRQARYPRMDG